ncbi:hypothetical protein DKX38_024177 [Salix brachista]|uniref:Ethylene-insensitive protein 2 n=1 Tax=Salix brachista TaxID=2182728 RepID=A0A5N5JKQ6_9ROSI|nr:hypothetical protein DKX38_024177 [Salix brachista]
MDTEFANANHPLHFLHRLLPAAGPGLLIAIGYVDPGKWAATVEGGARFGSDLVLPMLLFNFVAILCQYLSARIGVITRKDLAQICNDEYGKWTCMFLGVQAALSVIALDLTMVVSLNLSYLVHLVAYSKDMDLRHLREMQGEFTLYVHCRLHITFVFFQGSHQPTRNPSFHKWDANKIKRGECVCRDESTWVSANKLDLADGCRKLKLKLADGCRKFQSEDGVISGVGFKGKHEELVDGFKRNKSDFNVKDVGVQMQREDSGIYLVNYVLMISAANVLYSTGLVILTFSDAMSLMEQVFRSPVAPFGFSLILFFANHITAFSWNLGGQVVLHDFLRLDIPNWLQRAAFRIIAVVPALYCVWTSGVEGIYQLLILTQVMVALLLPSSVIPLFRVASSRQVMGVYKISPFLEFVALVSFMGVLGINIIFVVEMIFGDSDWVGNLRWSTGSGSSTSYIALLITACSSFCLMLWLAATPLKSATRLDAQAWNWDVQNAVSEPSMLIEEDFFTENKCTREELIERQEQLPEPGKSFDSYSDITVANADPDLPEKIMETDQERHLTTIKEKHSEVTISSSQTFYEEETLPTIESASLSAAVNLVPDAELLHYVFASDGPGSFRSLSGKSDEGGNGAGSLSRLAGLGRAARRHLAAALDEFWGQLYDFHGQITQEAKTKKLDALGVDLKLASSLLKVDTAGKESSRYFSLVGGRASDSLINSSLCNSPKQLQVQNMDSSYGAHRGPSSLWSNHMQLLDACVQGPSHSIVDSSERRYSGVRTLPSSDGWDNQPATVHGYQIPSIVNRIAKDRVLSSLNGQMESAAPISPSLGPRNYRDPLTVSMGQKLQNGLSSSQASGFQNLAVTRNSPLPSERPYHDVYSSGSAEDTGMSANTKKYHSLPAISGLAGPYRDLYMSEKSAQWDKSAEFGSFVSRIGYEQSYYSNTASGAGAGGPLSFNGLSKGHGDSFSLHMTPDPGSLWSKQPFEQFGVADKIRAVGSGIGNQSNSINHEVTSPVNSEAQLLWSFRHYIVKLLKLEGSDWLFRQNDGADQDLIDCVAARERYLYEAETREMSHVAHMGESTYLYSDRKSGSALRNGNASITNIMISLVPHCGEGCVWRLDLIISFGVWCIHRILDLSLMESRPELWGKYTYVLNHLQGIIELAFSKPRTPMSPCFCFHIPASHQHRSSPPALNGMLPPASKPGRGKTTTAATLLDLTKDVEIAISCRKGRSGTAAGDVAFPKGKENLASVLKRYKRRLSNRQ